MASGVWVFSLLHTASANPIPVLFFFSQVSWQMTHEVEKSHLMGFFEFMFILLWFSF